MDDVIATLKKWIGEGKQAAVAIVVKKKGSAMRPVGAKMVICADGSIQGSVSGGCVENAVIEEAQDCMRTNQTKLLHYGVSDDTAWSVGLMCGGEIDVLILPVSSTGEKGFDFVIIRKIEALQMERRPFMLLVHLSELRFGHTCILENDGGKIDSNAAEWIGRDQFPLLEEMSRTETSGIIETQTGKIYVDVEKPAPRLIIIGAVHTAMALVAMAKQIGIYTVLIDPRKAFATRERFAVVDELLTDWPEEGLAKVGLNSEDYVLLMTHDDKFDMPAAGAVLRANARYIGMLASRQTRERRFNLLIKEGFPKEQVERIHAPVGLDIGARTPEEIALAVLAEITAFRYGKVQ